MFRSLDKSESHVLQPSRSLRHTQRGWNFQTKSQWLQLYENLDPFVRTCYTLFLKEHKQKDERKQSKVAVFLLILHLCISLVDLFSILCESKLSCYTSTN